MIELQAEKGSPPTSNVSPGVWNCAGRRLKELLHQMEFFYVMFKFNLSEKKHHYWQLRGCLRPSAVYQSDLAKRGKMNYE